MKTPLCQLAAVAVAALIASDGRAQESTDRTAGEIPGNRGQLVLPLVPGPPTYTDPDQEERQDTGFGDRPIGQRCEPAAESPWYLDVASAAQRILQPAELYSGWRADELIGNDVHGARGEQLGEVKDVLVGPDERVIAITVIGGGFAQIGDAAFLVPWNQVVSAPGEDRVRVSLTKSEAERQGLFDGPDEVDAGPRGFRISEIVGDWTRLGDETESCFQPHGHIEDVVIGQAGNIVAVLEERSERLGGGLYAYPFFGYQSGWRPNYGYYDLPIEEINRRALRVDLARFGRAP